MAYFKATIEILVDADGEAEACDCVSETLREVLRERLRNGGFNAFIAADDTDAGRLYRVRVGPELERSRAETLAKQLKDKFRLSGMIVNHP